MTRPALTKWLSDTNDVTQTFLSAGQIPDLINMGGGLPEPSLWPVEELASLSAEVIRQHHGRGPGLQPDRRPPGAARCHRRAVQHGRASLTRENVLVTTAGMQALDLIGKVLLEEGGLIAAQTPAYLGALDAWRPSRPRYRLMRLEEEGFDPAAALKGAQFAYTVPNFSNPSGRLVGIEERRALMAAAHATGTWLLEDDPYGALYYDGPPLPRMLTLSGAGQAGPL